MSNLTLRNTMGNRREVFRPSDHRNVRVFTCGPSTYRRPHIGNYRTFLYEDLLVRHLEYLGYGVHRVINFTDVEDKAVDEAADRGLTVKELTEETHGRFRAEARTLGLRLPDRIPQASRSIDEAVAIIERLVERGRAYAFDGSYFFDVFACPEFGKLYGLDSVRMPERRVRFARDTYEGRRWNLGDFVLWHAESDDARRTEAAWETRIGVGRPSWNVQDPAMIVQNFGDSVDIVCGGIDNLYRHHDYNVAVMEAYSEKELAGFYLHGEHLVVNGRKMSKSAGNVLYPEHIQEAGYYPHHLRWYLMSAHYRTRLNFTWERFAEEAALIDGLRSVVENSPSAAGVSPSQEVLTVFEREMNDDLHAAGAVRGLVELFDGRSQLSPEELQAVERIDVVLGLFRDARNESVGP